MRYKLLFIINLFLVQLSYGQADDPWVRFDDTTNELVGYKDLQGITKMPARYGSFTIADTFHHIIAVHEMSDSSYKAFYLLKDGRKVGEDSVFMFDNTFDCESEGKIIFRDRRKDRVGFLDKNGAVVIPAVYNHASPFHNGFALALRNARRKCWGDDEDTTNCEHLWWAGGEWVLINDKNEILADSLVIDLYNINWYSLQLNNPSADTSIYTVIKGKNGITYSFIDYNKEFATWFYSEFLSSLTEGNSSTGTLLFSEVTYWTDQNGWTSLSRNDYMKLFPSTLTSERFRENGFKKLSISTTDLNKVIFSGGLYARFFNSCGLPNREMYPVFTVMLTWYDNDDAIDFQEQYDFIRTEEGYRLLSLPVKSQR